MSKLAQGSLGIYPRFVVDLAAVIITEIVGKIENENAISCVMHPLSNSKNSHCGADYNEVLRNELFERRYF